MEDVHHARGAAERPDERLGRAMRERSVGIDSIPEGQRRLKVISILR